MVYWLTLDDDDDGMPRIAHIKHFFIPQPPPLTEWDQLQYLL